MEREVEMGEWEEQFIRKIHGVYIQPGLSCMQERTDTLLRRLEQLELAQRDSTKRMEGLLPRVEEFLVKFAGTNETQLGAWVRSSRVCCPVRVNQIRPRGPPLWTPSWCRAAKGGGFVAAGHCEPSPSLPETEERGPGLGGRVESTFVQLRANDAQNKEALMGWWLKGCERSWVRH